MYLDKPVDKDCSHFLIYILLAVHVGFWMARGLRETNAEVSDVIGEIGMQMEVQLDRLQLLTSA